MKNVVITGASGMVGGLVLKECLESFEISRIVFLSRKSVGVKHKKLE